MCRLPTLRLPETASTDLLEIPHPDSIIPIMNDPVLSRLEFPDGETVYFHIAHNLVTTTTTCETLELSPNQRKTRIHSADRLLTTAF